MPSGLTFGGLTRQMQCVFVCPKGREASLSGGPFALASSVDGKLRSERLTRASLLLVTTHCM
jgi:hypothetical protein